MWSSMYPDQDVLDQIQKDLDICDRVFVYGTLQSTHGNNSLLSTASKLGVTKTTAAFALGDVGFPYAFHSSRVPEQYNKLLYPVKGEVYKLDGVTTFMSLDRLEGFPRHYNRRIVDTEMGLSAWMYHQDDWDCATHCEACHLVDGVWQWAK